MHTAWRVINPETLQALATRQGLNHRQIAAGLGWASHSYVSRILRGDQRTISPEAAVKLAAMLDAPVADLFLPTDSSKTGSNVRGKR